MPKTIEKLRWIRVYEWTAEINGMNLPLTQADFSVQDGKARLVLKRAISEDDTYRRLVGNRRESSVLLKCKTMHTKATCEVPAVWFQLDKIQVVSYWTENNNHNTATIRRLKNSFTELEEKEEEAIEDDDSLFAGEAYMFSFDTRDPKDAPGIDATSSGIMLECIAIESDMFRLS